MLSAQPRDSVLCVSVGVDMSEILSLSVARSLAPQVRVEPTQSALPTVGLLCASAGLTTPETPTQTADLTLAKRLPAANRRSARTMGVLPSASVHPSILETHMCPVDLIHVSQTLVDPMLIVPGVGRELCVNVDQDT